MKRKAVLLVSGPQRGVAPAVTAVVIGAVAAAGVVGVEVVAGGTVATMAIGTSVVVIEAIAVAIAAAIGAPRMAGGMAVPR